MEDKYWLWLSSIHGIGARRCYELVNSMGSPYEVWKASKLALKSVKGIGEHLAELITSLQRQEYLDGLIRSIETNNIEYVTIKSTGYPHNLKNIYDPPPVLYYKGKLSQEGYNTIAIVGSRHTTAYGRRVAIELSQQLSMNKFVIVSGMARGIDTLAHKGVLDVDGVTIAVLGSGLDIIYPPENSGLAKAITEKGALVSEYCPGTEPSGGNFPARNRIISGLSDGVLVIEAGKRSGSLITCDFALEQGREIFAVPGPITSSLSKGTNNLIREGARLVQDIDDILEEFGIGRIYTSRQQSMNNVFDDDERIILQQIEENGTPIDQIIANIQMPVGKINYTLSLLEIKGIIKQLPGKIFIKSF
jgi:DNA processing protein